MPNGSTVKVTRETDADLSWFQKMLIFIFLFCSLVR